MSSAPPAGDWESQADTSATPAAADAPADTHTAAPARRGLRADAPAFTLSAGASEFIPGGASTHTPAPAPAPAEPAVEAPAAVAAPEAAAVAAPSAAGASTPAAGEDEGEDGEEPEEPHAVGTEDPREHLNVIFIGHVDAGKSTLSGSILYHTGQIDARSIEKFEREAKAKNRESWFLAFILDTTDEERTKGITVEVGRATFETKNKRFTILDAPGHKNYVPNMIAGAAQADVAVLVISARKGEFETGFERGGQTREHALLAKTLGVRYLIVVINKMDEPTVKWAKERYDDIVGKLTPFLKSSGYQAKHVTFIPIAGLTGANVKDRAPKEVCPWYTGPSLLEFLDTLSIPGRDPEGPLRVPVLDKYMDRGLITMGKVESGTIREGMKVVVMPQRIEATVDTVFIDDVEVKTAKPGENVKLKIKGCREEDILRGFMLCDLERPIIPVKQFEAQIMLMELEAHSLFTAGYSAVLHVHTAQEDCTVKKLVAEIDKKTGEPKAGACPPFFKSGSSCVAVLECSRAVCVEKFDVHQQLGRFTLRDGQRTIAIGKILRLGIPKSQVEAYKKVSSGGAAGASAV